MGIKMLSKIQLGQEGTPGTPVAATAIWRGIGVIEDQRETIFPEENIGLLVASDRAYTPKLAASISMDAVEATFEQLPYIFEGGLKAIGTGAADGAGTGVIYDYTLPITSPVSISDTDTIKTFTIEAGDNVEAEEMEYAFVSEFTLSGEAGGSWQMASTWLGRQCTTSTFTGAIAIPAVEEVLFSKTKLYIDSSSNTFGTTVVANTLISAEMKVKTGWIPVFTGDGALYFSFAKNVGPTFDLSLTFEHNASAVAERANWRNSISRNVALIAQGSAFATAGTAYTYKTMQLNLAGRWEVFEALGEKDGNSIVTAKLKGAYNATNAVMGNFIVVNALAAVV